MRRFLKKDLHLKPYQVHECHGLKPADHAKRVRFADWLLSRPPKAKTTMILSDEAWLYLTLPINKENDRTWTLEKLLEYIERPQKILKIVSKICHFVVDLYSVSRAAYIKDN